MFMICTNKKEHTTLIKKIQMVTNNHFRSVKIYVFVIFTGSDQCTIIRSYNVTVMVPSSKMYSDRTSNIEDSLLLKTLHLW